MAKVSIKSEKITPFGGIFHVREHFSRFVGPVIDKVLGHRCTSFGYQSARLWVLCLVSTSVAATVWMMWRPIWCPISRFIPLFANATLTQFSGESLSWAAPTRPILLTRERTTTSIQLLNWTVCWWRCSWTLDGVRGSGACLMHNHVCSGKTIVRWRSELQN